jgi:outer membrane receptor for ferrienterochelin and colicins
MPTSRAVLVLLACAVFAVPISAQNATTVRIEVRADRRPLANGDVAVNGSTHTTDAEGVIVVPVAPGEVDIVAMRDGFVPVNVTVKVAEGQRQTVAIDLIPQPTVEEEVTVAATRTDKRLDDLPMRVEVLVREEIEEKMLMTPGDIVMMLNEMGGMRVQATSPSLGAASVRIQGMRGRYTRFLSDGLPLFGEVGGLGLLQIPPIDLGQVEVIKGTASALYGAGAMGGVVNLISRRPSDEPMREVLFNRSSRGATDAVLFAATPVSEQWRMSLLASGHWQEQVDVDDDEWADLPRYARGVFRPRVFWDGENGRTFFATLGATFEDREGGTMDGVAPRAIGAPYREALATRRLDGGAVAQMVIGQQRLLTARLAFGRQRHAHQFGEVRERDNHLTAFGEVAVRGATVRHTWVVGAAIERDRYDPRDLPRFAYTFTIPGVFVQDDVAVTRWLSLSASGRLDHHSEYGTFFSPRVSGLVRSSGWTVRLSGGTGFFGPTFLTEETEAAGLSRLTVPRALVAERGRSVSLDVTRSIGPASATVTAFASRVGRPIDVDRSSAFTLTNAADATTNTGVELLATLRHAPFAVTGTYTFVNARESDGGRRVDVPLTPRHSAGIVLMAEAEDVGRVGAELYYTGRQRLAYNPYRERSEPYVIAGFLAERKVGRVRLFVNAENITNVRQTHWDGLLLPQRAVDGRWTVDAWAPLEGRNVNGGIRLEL